MMGLAFGLKDVIDILLVAVILYEVYHLLRKSGAANLFWGIFAFIVAWFLVCYVFELELTGALFDRIISVGAIALIIIFQEEIRAFFYRIGARFSSVQKRIRRDSARQEKEEVIHQIVEACQNMSKTKTGALIVITNEQELDDFINSGEHLDARISARMIENIFFKNTPLHDGALFISEARLCSAACILPVSKNPNLPQQYGLRHRAALGITEKTDAIAIVVSEETGKLSLSIGESIEEISAEDLIVRLTSLVLKGLVALR